MGNGSVLRPGEVQRMSAGTGVLHSEFNHSREERVHLLQIWILPEREGVEPSYEEKTFDASEKQGRLRLVASREGSDGSVRINQDAKLYAALLEPGQQLAHRLAPGRHAWLQVARGAVELNGHTLRQGDGAAVSDEETLSIVGAEPSEVLLFDLN